VFGAPDLPDAGPFVALMKTTSLSLEHQNTDIMKIHFIITQNTDK